MQKWEYLIVLRDRGFKERPKDKHNQRPTDWEIKIITKAEEKEWKGKMIDLLIKLGDDGWELAATWARSDILGGAHETVGSIKPVPFTNGSEGTIHGITTDFAGYTDGEEWVFKRPRP